MISKIKDAIRNVFNSDEKEKDEQSRKTAYLQQKTNNVLANNEYNPFVDKDGKIINPMLNYQKLLDNPNVSQKAKEYISAATGLVQSSNIAKKVVSNNSKSTTPQQSTSENITVNFNANADSNNLGNMDIINDVPKLTQGQIKEIISKHYKNSTVVSPTDAEAIYNAQNKTGVSALVTLSIGGLESGWGTSNIAKKTNNIWGYGATNDNPLGNAHKYSSMANAAEQYSESLKKTYYNGYGAKTINSIGTGNNPAGKGYAYNDNGTISTTWSPTVTSIMKTLYNTAKTVK